MGCFLNRMKPLICAATFKHGCGVKQGAAAARASAAHQGRHEGVPATANHSQEDGVHHGPVQPESHPTRLKIGAGASCQSWKCGDT